MVQKVKTAGPYLLTLFLIVLLIGFNSWTSRVEADGANEATTTITVGNAEPVVSSVSLAYGDDIILTENTDTQVMLRAVITDTNGCEDIWDGSIKAYIYQASQTASCSADTDDCYLIASCSTDASLNDCTGGSDTDLIASCSVDIWYFAVPTDGTSSDSGDEWYGAVMVTDASGDDDIASSSTQTVDVQLSRALEASSSIAYDALSADSDSGGSPKEMGIENTGNSGMNPKIAATTTLVCSTGDCNTETIADANQKYASVSIDYSDAYNVALSGTATELELDLPKPTNITSPVDAQIFLGLGIDAGQTAGDYAGVNTFTAVGD